MNNLLAITNTHQRQAYLHAAGFACVRLCGGEILCDVLWQGTDGAQVAADERGYSCICDSSENKYAPKNRQRPAIRGNGLKELHCGGVLGSTAEAVDS